MGKLSKKLKKFYFHKELCNKWLLRLGISFSTVYHNKLKVSASYSSIATLFWYKMHPIVNACRQMPLHSCPFPTPGINISLGSANQTSSACSPPPWPPPPLLVLSCFGLHQFQHLFLKFELCLCLLIWILPACIWTFGLFLNLCLAALFAFVHLSVADLTLYLYFTFCLFPAWCFV